MGDLSLTYAETQAVRSYGRAFMHARSQDKPELRLDGQDRLRAARKVLEPREVAVLDLLSVGHSLDDLGRRTGRADLPDLVKAGATKLADVFEKEADNG